VGAVLRANVDVAARFAVRRMSGPRGRTEALKIASRLRALEMRALEMMDVERRLNPDIDRRDLLRVLATGAGAVAASAAPLAAAAAERENTDAAKKRRARYQPNSPEVQTFYRVNRYPAK
jgi:hypothetical protein